MWRSRWWKLIEEAYISSREKKIATDNNRGKGKRTRRCASKFSKSLLEKSGEKYREGGEGENDHQR